MKPFELQKQSLPEDRKMQLRIKIQKRCISARAVQTFRDTLFDHKALTRGPHPRR